MCHFWLKKNKRTKDKMQTNGALNIDYIQLLCAVYAYIKHGCELVWMDL